MTVFLWSETAATNASVDPTVNWAEGQSPPSVNNSARAMMAAVAKYRDDMAGIIVNQPPMGTASYGTFAGISSQKFSFLGPSVTTLPDHQIFSVIPTVDSPPASQMDLDGVGIWPALNASGNAIIEGQLQAGCSYLFRYKLSDASVYLENPPLDLDQSVPVGAIMLFAGNVLPSARFAWCNGQALDQATYATLFSLIHGTYGTGGPESAPTFNIPNVQALTIIGERLSSGAIPSASTLTRTSGNATVNGTVIGWTIVLPYIMRII
jgi:hypothetical protein